MRLRARGLVLTLVILGACGSDGGHTIVSPSAPSDVATPSSSPSITTGTTVQDVIDLGGQEVLGLALTEDAVWAIAYQTGTLSRSTRRATR